MKKYALLLFFLFGIFIVILSVNANKKTKIIVIDPGHGGYDPGCVVLDVKEANLNLSISLKLKKALEQSGYSCILTRENEDDLCEGEFKKIDDLRKRIEKTKSVDCDIFISIHMNKFESEKERGAQVFYSNSNEENENLANLVQGHLEFFLKNTKRRAKRHDKILVLNNIKAPSVLVECGFMSNEEELALLINNSYQNEIASAISSSIRAYLE